MPTSEILKDVEEFANKYKLVIGSIGFDESGDLEKVYLFKSRAKARANHTHPYPRGEASAFIIPGSMIWERGKVKSYWLQHDLT